MYSSIRARLRYVKNASVQHRILTKLSTKREPVLEFPKQTHCKIPRNVEGKKISISDTSSRDSRQKSKELATASLRGRNRAYIYIYSLARFSPLYYTWLSAATGRSRMRLVLDFWRPYYVESQELINCRGISDFHGRASVLFMCGRAVHIVLRSRSVIRVLLLTQLVGTSSSFWVLSWSWFLNWDCSTKRMTCVYRVRMCTGRETFLQELVSPFSDCPLSRPVVIRTSVALWFQRIINRVVSLIEDTHRFSFNYVIRWREYAVKNVLFCKNELWNSSSTFPRALICSGQKAIKINFTEKEKKDVNARKMIIHLFKNSISM